MLYNYTHQCKQCICSGKWHTFYRITDVIIQTSLLALWLASWFADRRQTLNFYFITGAWFLPSLVVHWFIGAPRYQHSYNTLLVTSAIIIGVAIIGFVCLPLLVAELFILLVLGPIMAITFTLTSIAEIIYLCKSA